MAPAHKLMALETLRGQPGGVRVPQPPHYRKFADDVNGAPRGFKTPTRKIELYSEMMLQHGVFSLRSMITTLRVRIRDRERQKFFGVYLGAKMIGVTLVISRPATASETVPLREVLELPAQLCQVRLQPQPNHRTGVHRLVEHDHRAGQHQRSDLSGRPVYYVRVLESSSDPA